MIEPVPRTEVARLFPQLSDEPLWGEEDSYDYKRCAGLWWIVYGPVDPATLVRANRMFKGVKIVNKGV